MLISRIKHKFEQKSKKILLTCKNFPIIADDYVVRKKSALSENNMLKEEYIVNYLDNKGFRHSMKGFKFLVQMIQHLYDNQEDMKKFSKIYEIIAEKNAAKVNSVERDIRYSIHKAIDKPSTNKEFVAKALSDLTKHHRMQTPGH